MVKISDLFPLVRSNTVEEVPGRNVKKAGNSSCSRVRLFISGDHVDDIAIDVFKVIDKVEPASIPNKSISKLFRKPKGIGNRLEKSASSLFQKICSYAKSLNPVASVFQSVKRDFKITSFGQKLISLFEKKTPGCNFKNKADEIVLFLEKHCPEKVQEIRALLEEHKPLMQELVEKGGWKNLKSAKQGAMAEKGATGLSHEEFRAEVVKAVIDLCLDAMKKTGFEKPGKHSATGTPGWNSDIDTVYLAPASMPEKIQNMEKILFDVIFYGIFGGPSGRLFDTESYLNHAAAAFKTEKFITTEDGKSSYANVELTAACLQLLMQHESSKATEWEKTTKSMIRSAHKELQNPLATLLTTVTLLEEDIQKQLRIEMEKEGHKAVSDGHHSEEAALAMMSLKTRVLLRIGREMDQTKAEIKKLEPSGASQLGALEMQHLKLAALAILRNRFFDEGYNSQGAFTKICFLYGGQIHQRRVSMQRREIIKSRNEEFPFVGEFRLNPDQKEKSNPGQNIISAWENLAMYKGHFRHALPEEAPQKRHYQKALISQSKYSERILSAASEIIEALDQRGSEVPPQFREALREAFFKASELEKVKRKNQINKSTFEKLITCELDKIDPNIKIDKSRELKAVIEILEKGGDLYEGYQKAMMIPESLYLMQTSAIAALLLNVELTRNEHGLPEGNERIMDIIKARCGLDLKAPGVKAILEESESITLQALGFDSLDEIIKFNESIEELTMKAQNLGIEAGLLSKPSKGVKGDINLLYLWQIVTI